MNPSTCSMPEGSSFPPDEIPSLASRMYQWSITSLLPPKMICQTSMGFCTSTCISWFPMLWSVPSTVSSDDGLTRSTLMAVAPSRAGSDGADADTRQRRPRSLRSVQRMSMMVGSLKRFVCKKKNFQHIENASCCSLDIEYQIWYVAKTSKPDGIAFQSLLKSAMLNESIHCQSGNQSIVLIQTWIKKYSTSKRHPYVRLPHPPLHSALKFQEGIGKVGSPEHPKQFQKLRTSVHTTWSKGCIIHSKL